MDLEESGMNSDGKVIAKLTEIMTKRTFQIRTLLNLINMSRSLRHVFFLDSYVLQYLGQMGKIGLNAYSIRSRISRKRRYF